VVARRDIEEIGILGETFLGRNFGLTFLGLLCLQRSVGCGLTKFVGRERQMEVLQHTAEQAKPGASQITAAKGEAASRASFSGLKLLPDDLLT
jgi:hypothetical protein